MLANSNAKSLSEEELAIKAISEHVARLSQLQHEANERKIKAQLIALGWTPPAEKKQEEKNTGANEAKPRPTIQGYRPLSLDEIELINNAVKIEGEYLRTLVDRIEGYRMKGTGVSQRWIDIGRDYLQQGLMALTRAIAKPEGF